MKLTTVTNVSIDGPEGGVELVDLELDTTWSDDDARADRPNPIRRR
jgi:hypothetical protein